ncbi:hypothetical protein CY34DRAFT_444009 [Suillus luteus UH-Slu-Lm8-n1]|uniref:Uncharacterized protein n=1 Tax=Suillus luteus UH-Slu-Lm8-n1 TaxID=930992 RepID=A0A0D0B123_9AGAM|nr:hypothetical protein CY34DRAFT_444009 [Suillus luteus UH-Slu-Lm8-n1]
MSSPLFPTIAEDEQVDGANIWLQDSRATKAKGRRKGSQSLSLKDWSQPQSEVVSLHALSDSRFTSLSDNGLCDKASISNWLFERHAYTIGRIKIAYETLANKTKINAMVDLYDQITASIGSKGIKVILSNAKVDGYLLKIKEEINTKNAGHNSEQNLLQHLFLYDPDGNPATQEKEKMPSKNTSDTDILLPVLLAEYKKKDTSAISTAMNQMRMYQVSAVTFLSALGITDQPVFGLVVNGTLGAITMAWKTNDQIYVMERNVRHYDIRDPLQALQFVSILRRLA